MRQSIHSPLKGKWIAITRPEHQAEPFSENIQKVGGCLLHFPLIAITPFSDDKTRKKLNELIDYDMVIFVSSNAVEQCVKLIGTEILKHKTLVTTGKKTAQTLINHDLSVDFCPEKHFNSESLLGIKAFKEQSKGKKVAIIRGSSGRDYLKNNLIDLGASVDYIDVYSRHCPQKNLDQLKTACLQNELDVILLTSASSTASFFELAKDEDWINGVTLLIGSSRMQHEIPDWFKGKILIAEDPSDETLFKKLTLELI
ncbi:MAG: uroporphyrinogen-III synthase [Cocleimonas sp.]